jgi:hypothetical protein
MKEAKDAKMRNLMQTEQFSNKGTSKKEREREVMRANKAMSELKSKQR